MASSSNEILLSAFEYETAKKAETERAYDFGTASPIPRDNHATMWMTCNFGDSVWQDISDFFTMASSKLQARVERLKHNKVAVKDLNGNIRLLGQMYGDERSEANVGRYVIFFASSEAGCEMVIKITSFCQWGYSCFIFHDRISRQITNDKVLTVSSGIIDDNSEKVISTRFEISIDKTIAARCNLSYRDLSIDPSIGPTVEMIAVHQDFRGQGLLTLLWFWVKTFIEDNFTLESLNKDAPVKHTQIKATKLSNVEIEQIDGKPITDRQFFFDYAGFSVRKQIGFPLPSIPRIRRPIDEEAVLYIPLLTRQQVKERAEKRFMGDEAVDYSGWKKVKGARNCKFCQNIKMGLLRCSRCGQAYYCNLQCQKKDYKKHKMWCGKSRQELHEELVSMGLRVQNDDGSWSSVMD